MVLPDISDDELIGDGVEAKSKRIAESVGEDLGDVAGAGERIGSGDAILAVGTDGIGAGRLTVGAGIGTFKT